MSSAVLKRDLDAYQRAVEAYRRSAKTFNGNVDKYQGTLVKDQRGLPMVYASGSFFAISEDGKMVPAVVPDNFDVSGYGLTDLGSGYQMIRQAPVKANRETVTGVLQNTDPDGKPYFYTPNSSDEGGSNTVYGAEWRVDSETPAQGESPATFTLSRDASEYPTAPTAWTNAFKLKAPDPTAAQIRGLTTPSNVALERGLVGEVLQGRGVR